MSDFSIYDDGSVVLFTPETESAQTFSEDEMGLESWQWLGRSFAVDHRVASDLVAGLELAGFEVSL